MASETTIYDVVTRYVLNDQASTPMNRVEQNANKVERALARGERQMRAWSSSLAMMGRYVGPLIGVATAGAAAAKALENFNQASVRTNQLAAAFSLNFVFDADPIKNYAASVAAAERLVSKTLVDAKRLPATSADLFGSLQLLASPLFSAGRSDDDVRRMVANLSNTALQAGQTQRDAPNQALRAIMGAAGSAGDNPLYGWLYANKAVPDAETFNKLPQAERIRRLDAAFEKFGGNVMFNDRFARTFEVQMSTLEEALLGSSGIAGQAFSGTYDNLIASLADLNESVTTYTPGIVGGLRSMSDTLSGLWDAVTSIPGVGPMIARGMENSAKYGYRSLGAEAARMLMRPNEREGMVLSNWVVEGDLAKSRVQSSPATDIVNRIPYLGPHLMEHFGAPPEALRVAQGAEAMAKLFAEANAKDAKFSQMNVRSAIRTTNDELGKLPEFQVAAMSESEISQRLRKNLEAAMSPPEGKPGGTGPIGGNNVNMKFEIKIDVKSDESPEAIAVKLDKAMRRFAGARTRSARVMPTGPGTSATQ